MKKLSIITTFLICLAFAGCGANKDAEVGAFISETDKLASDIVKTVNANPSQTGLDQAQKLLDAKKTELKNKCDSIKKLRGFELSKEMTDKLSDSIADNVSEVGSLQIDYAEKAVEDAKFAEKLNKLYQDFSSIYGV